MNDPSAVYHRTRCTLVLLLFSICLSGIVVAQNASADSINTLIVGGSFGNSHNFQKWWGNKDVETLRNAGINVKYTEDPAEIVPVLEDIDVLLLANNKPIPQQKTRDAIFQFVKQGGGLILNHAATWYNWEDWPEYNRKLVAGGADGHVHTSPFRVELRQSEHPLLTDVSRTFEITDELYHFEKDKKGPPITVLGEGTHEQKNKTYPVLWTVDAYPGRIVCNTLGHDGRAHKLPAYQQLLINSVRWTARGGHN